MISNIAVLEPRSLKMKWKRSHDYVVEKGGDPKTQKCNHANFLFRGTWYQQIRKVAVLGHLLKTTNHQIKFV